MGANEIVEVFNCFSSKNFIDTIEKSVNSFSFDMKSTVRALIKMPEGKRRLLLQAIDACIYALAYTCRIDGRNEAASEVCKKLNPKNDSMPDVGYFFSKMHPTLQQAAAKLFCCYLDEAEVAKYKEAIERIKKEEGTEWWYCFPLI